MRMLRNKLRFTVAVSAVVIIGGCDSIDKEAKKIMADQGLTLVEPARDYIALGGIVTLGKKLQYEDPYDTLPNDNGTYSSFSAIVSQNTQNQSIGIDLALGTIANVVTLPASVSGAVNHSSSVNLSQIDTGGTRYTTQKVAALLQKQATNDATKADLQAGLRTFVIQEVYTATSFKITSSNSTSIAAAAGGSAPKPQCSETDTSGSKNSDSASATSGNTGSGNSGTANSKSGSPESPSPGAPSAGTGSKNSSGSGSGNSGSSNSGSAKTGSSGNSGSGSAPMSMGTCWTGNSSLSFTTARPIPFAVRLNEVELGPGGVVQVKKKDFRLPLNTLGGDNVTNSVTLPSGTTEGLERKTGN
jgi:hypothetical protein